MRSSDWSSDVCSSDLSQSARARARRGRLQPGRARGRRRGPALGSGTLMGRGHGHAHTHATGRAEDRKRLQIVLAVTATVMVVEVIGAFITGSLALLADAGHMATDAAAVPLALGASSVATLRPGPGATVGYQRAELLAALLNALCLLGVCGHLAYAGISTDK